MKNLLFGLAFIEGGGVMCVELCSAKLLSPYFGTSIYVWASVLGITLTALMSGYYFGGYISSNYKKKEIVLWLMLIGGCFVSLIPIIGDIVLPITINLNILIGTVLSLMCILFIPLLLFGATSPILINQLTENAKDSGKSSGNIYAVSTFGGIIATFTIGFYTLPQFGISLTLYVYGLLVIIITLVLFFKTKSFKASTIILLIIPIIAFNFRDSGLNEEIIYKSEGILGEIKIVDRKRPNENNPKIYRELMVNNISQTIMDLDSTNKSYWHYVDILTHNIKTYSNGKSTLLLGLGGGTLYKQLTRNNFKVDVVELDQRIKNIAIKYFDIDKNANIIVDDARHYINTVSKKYDVVIYDLYHSESQPVHLLTKEAFHEVKNKLTDRGILIINFYGFLSGNKGKAARSIYKTLLHENYHINLIATPGIEASRNLIFVCAKEKLISNGVTNKLLINKSDIELDDALILTDNKPVLDHIYLEAALAWRSGYNEINTKYFMQQKN